MTVWFHFSIDRVLSVLYSINLSPRNGPHSGPFLIEPWNIYWQTRDSMPRTDNSTDASTAQHKAQLQMCSSIWKLIPLLMKKEILAKKEKVECWTRRWIRKQKKKKYTMNERLWRLWRQMLTYSTQNKISYLQCCHEYIQYIMNVFKYFAFYNSL